MNLILGDIPTGQRDAAAAALPGLRPVGQADWITVDRCYAAQIALKAKLLRDHRCDVLQQQPQADEAAAELLAEIVALLRHRAD